MVGKLLGGWQRESECLAGGGLYPPRAAGTTGSGEENQALPTVEHGGDETGWKLSGQKRRLHCLLTLTATPVHADGAALHTHYSFNPRSPAGSRSEQPHLERIKEQSGDLPKGTRP